MRLRRNCSLASDFLLQAQELKSKFIDKGYDENDLMSTIGEVALMDGRDLLSNNNRRHNPNESFKSSFITSFFYSTLCFNNNFSEALIGSHKWQCTGTCTCRTALCYFQRCTIIKTYNCSQCDRPVKSIFFQDLKGFFPMSQM